MLGCKFFGIVGEHIRTEYAVLFIIMHNHWFHFRIEDLDRGFAVLDSFLDGEAAHSFE